MGNITKAKSILKSIDSLRHYWCYLSYASQFKRYLKLQHIRNVKAEGEDAYIRKWKDLSSRIEPYSYRFFRNYCGNTPNIVPENVGRSYIEEVLNPMEYRVVYSDKNLFPKIIGRENCPRTILCRINGSNLLDGEYRPATKNIGSYFGDLKSLILKPTVNSCSGDGIMKFVRRGDEFISMGGGKLTKEFLISYSNDFCLQEALSQHSFMNTLCSTSVNTIRLCLYRSVRDEDSKIIASIIRVGRDGSYLDNAHAGGMFVGVDVKTGKLGEFVVDQYGNKKNVWNGLDYSQAVRVVPGWDRVISFAKAVGEKILHHRLIALDIALDDKGTPKLIEYNVEGFSYWLYQYTGHEALGEFTDEIISYCKKYKR